MKSSLSLAIVLALSVFWFPGNADAEIRVALNRGVLNILDLGRVAERDGVVEINFQTNDRLFVETSDDTVRVSSLISFPVRDDLILAFPRLEINIQTGVGNDLVVTDGLEVGSLDIRTSTGNDDLVIGRTIANRDLTMFTGAGEDDVSSFDLEVARFTELDTGGSTDSVSVRDSSFGNRVLINTGPNTASTDGLFNESVTITGDNIFLGPLHVETGGGDDQLFISGDVFYFVRVVGGVGNDSFGGIDDEDVAIGPVRIFGFETF